MSNTDDDPLLGLLTDIAEGVTLLVERVDAIEDRLALQNVRVTEALAAIAEIAARTYYAVNPVSALPADVIDTEVMDAMIERWPTDAIMSFPASEAKPLRNLEKLSVEEIEALIRARGAVAEYAANSERLCHARALALMHNELSKRVKGQKQNIEREGPGRSR